MRAQASAAAHGAMASLRAGFVTTAVKRGANLLKITDVTGHRSLEMLMTYSCAFPAAGHRLEAAVAAIVTADGGMDSPVMDISKLLSSISALARADDNRD
jgi:hypothetical protein